MTSPQTKLRIILLSLVALALGALFIFDFQQARSKNAEVVRLTSLSSETDKTEKLSQLVRSFQTIERKELAAFDKIVLSNTTLIPMIESIESAGRSLGLTTKITSIDKSGGETASSPQKIEIVVEADGAWRGSILFLKALESLPHRIAFESVNFSKERGVWHTRVTLSLNSFQ